MKVDVPFELIAGKAFVDIPASEPRVRYPLPRVGISNRPYYVRVTDPFDGSMRELLTHSSFSFPLPASQRGLHMSRIEECLTELRDSFSGNLVEYGAHLCQRLTETQGGLPCTVELNVQYEKPVTKNISERPSSELITLILRSECDGSARSVVRQTLGMTVPFMNACPCTQRWGMRSFYDKLKDRGYEEEAIRELVRLAPLQAHTNLGKATLLLSGADDVTFDELYTVLDCSVSIVRELLKGMDENDFVRAVHEGGQFCEDGARAVAEHTASFFNGRLSDDTGVSIAVVVDESVHFHNLHAEVSTTLGELKDVLKAHAK